MMKFSTLINSSPKWLYEDDGDEIVISSRVRLARNVEMTPFPGWAEPNVRVKLKKSLKDNIIVIKGLKTAFCRDMNKLTKVQKQVLVERHLISREHAAKDEGGASIINKNQSISIMINEEDHLRIQALLSGLKLNESYKLIEEIDTELSNTFDFAFDKKLGFLTSCPTNLGTGMRASVMLHLPALVLTEQIKQVVDATNKLDLTVRGIYGEGTEALSNLFQISNQNTLGDNEKNIITQLEKVVKKIIDHEKNARKDLLNKKLYFLKDSIGRAYGTLKYSHIIGSKEALSHLSMIRLGADLGFFPKEISKVTEQLITEIQPAHIQIKEKRIIETKERDTLRSSIIREKYKDLEISLDIKV